MKHLIKLIILLFVLPLQAQPPFRQEYNIHLGGGLSTLQQSALVGNKDFAGTTGLAGISYTRFFSSHWGVDAGIEAAFHYNVFSADRILQESIQSTPQGLAGTFYTHIEYIAYQERQQAWLLQLPVRLIYQAPLGKQYSYTSVGFKVALPLSGSENISVQALTTAAYSDYTGQTYSDMPGHGFETLYNVDRYSNPELKPYCMLSFETGFKWSLSGKNMLSAGVFFDYGKVVSQIQPLAFGLKMRISTGSGKMKTKK